ncbi:MAG TPA: hypothetical protein VJ826_03845 [Candidatus Polarisedimenticolaceae bacterium]|nr:hypothetical protein [Candidatus Polarisedimenticolaceae bacterium]
MPEGPTTSSFLSSGATRSGVIVHPAGPGAAKILVFRGRPGGGSGSTGNFSVSVFAYVA